MKREDAIERIKDIERRFFDALKNDQPLSFLSYMRGRHLGATTAFSLCEVITIDDLMEADKAYFDMTKAQIEKQYESGGKEKLLGKEETKCSN